VVMGLLARGTRGSVTLSNVCDGETMLRGDDPESVLLHLFKILEQDGVHRRGSEAT